MQRVIFTDSPDSDGNEKFNQKKDNAGGKKKKKGIAAIPAPILKRRRRIIRRIVRIRIGRIGRKRRRFQMGMTASAAERL